MFVVIRMTEYAFPAAVSIFSSYGDAENAAREAIRSEGKQVTAILRSVAGHEGTQFCTQGEESLSCYLIMPA